MDGIGLGSSARLRLQQVMLWLPEKVRAAIVREASDKYPLETGGVLLGYWNEEHVVITQESGPGPDAHHGRLRFRPDHEYQQRWISRGYRQSEGAETYLGDWHTHPGAKVAAPSFLDRATARRVALSEAARAPNPVTLILAGDRDGWFERAWVAELVPLLRRFRHCRLDAVEIRHFRR